MACSERKFDSNKLLFIMILEDVLMREEVHFWQFLIVVDKLGVPWWVFVERMLCHSFCIVP